MVLAGVVVAGVVVTAGVVVAAVVVAVVVVSVGVVVAVVVVTAEVVVVAAEPQAVSSVKNVAVITMNKSAFFNIFTSLFPEDNHLFLYSLFIVYDNSFVRQFTRWIHSMAQLKKRLAVSPSFDALTPQCYYLLEDSYAAFTYQVQPGRGN
jgi:uncharacterized membrane protein